MATITDAQVLEIQLAIKNSAFIAGLAKTENMVRKFSSRLVSEMKYTAKAIGALLTGAFAILAYQITKTTGTVSDLVDESTRLGISVRPLQRLQYAAKQSGVSVESMNTAVKRLLKSTQEAADGNVEMSATLRKLGIDSTTFSQLGADAQYVAIADAIKKIKNPAEQVSVAMKLMGRSGAEQLSLMKDDISGLIREFKSLGTELSDGQAKSIESFGDSIGFLGAAWDGFKQQLMAALSGPLQEFAKWIADGIKNMGGMSSAAESVGSSIVSSMKTAVSAVKAVVDMYDRLSEIRRANRLIDVSQKLAVANTQVQIDATHLGSPEKLAASLKVQAALIQEVRALSAQTIDKSVSSNLSTLSSKLGQSSSSESTGGGGSMFINGKPIDLGSSGMTINGKEINLNTGSSFTINGKDMMGGLGEGQMTKNGKLIKLDINVNTDSGLTASVVNSQQNRDVIINTVNSAVSAAASAGAR